MDVDHEALRRFVAVAEQLHFTRTAAALGISRQALSRSVRLLEEQLGADLFVRPSDRTELTAAGRDLLDRSGELLGDDRDVEAATGTDTRAPRPTGLFRVGIMPGVTLSKWSTIWSERRPDLPLDVIRTDEATQVAWLHDGALDVSFVRLPVDREGLSVIPLYAEVPVVVVPTDHLVTAADEVSVADLVDEHLLQDPDTVPQWRDAAARLRRAPTLPLPPIRSTADAIALVAAGVGVVIVPKSVARLHHRKDLTYRPVTDVEPSQVALAWVTERTSAEIEEFVGVVRGRSARSSRAPAADGTSADEGSRDAARPERAASTPVRHGPLPARKGSRTSTTPKGKRRGMR